MAGIFDYIKNQWDKALTEQGKADTSGHTKSNVKYTQEDVRKVQIPSTYETPETSVQMPSLSVTNQGGTIKNNVYFEDINGRNMNPLGMTDVKTRSDFSSDKDYEDYVYKNNLTLDKDYVKSKQDEYGANIYAKIFKEAEDRYSTYQLRDREDINEDVNQRYQLITKDNEVIDSNQYENEVNAINSKLTSINSQIDNLNNLYNQGTINETEYQNKYNSLKNEWETNQNELDRYSTKSGYEYYDYIKDKDNEKAKEFEQYVGSYDDSTIQKFSNIVGASWMQTLSTIPDLVGYAKQMVTSEKMTGDNLGTKLTDDAQRFNEYALTGTKSVEKFSLKAVQGIMPFVNDCLIASCLGLTGEAFQQGTLIAGGVSSFTRSAREMTQEGYDNFTVTINSIMNGAISYLVEKMDVGNIAMLTGDAFKQVASNGLYQILSNKQIASTLFQSAVGEGLEEGVESILDDLAMLLTSGINAVFNPDAKELEIHNFESLASKYMDKETYTQLAEEMIYGAAGGLLMGIPSSINAKITSKKGYNWAKEQVNYLESAINSPNITEDAKVNAIKNRDFLISEMGNYDAQSQTKGIEYVDDVVQPLQSFDDNNNLFLNAQKQNSNKVANEMIEIARINQNIETTTQNILTSRGIDIDSNLYLNLDEKTRQNIKNNSVLDTQITYEDVRSKNGDIIDGYYKDGKLVVNPYAKDGIDVALSHEMTHRLEGTKYYNNIKTLINENYDGNVIAEKSRIKELYKDAGIELNDSGSESEFIAKQVQRIIGDENLVSDLALYNTSLFNKLSTDLNSLIKNNADVKIKNNFLKAYDKLLSNGFVGKLGDDTFTENEAMLSISQYHETGRKKLESFLDNQVNNKKITTEDRDQILNTLDFYADTFTKLIEDGDYPDFSRWSNVSMAIDQKGNPLISCVVKNGDYKLNIDFSTVCRKRKGMDAVLNELAKSGMLDYKALTEEQIGKLRQIIKKNDLEVSCSLCFVDSKRYKQGGYAWGLVDKWNGLVDLLKGNQDVQIGQMNFAERENVNTDYLKTIDKNGEAELKKLASGTDETSKMARLLLNKPEMRKYISLGDFYGSKAFENIRKGDRDFFKIANAHQGVAKPKSPYLEVTYNNEIITKKGFNPLAAKKVGGVRIQSFSDYMANMVFDYLEMIGELQTKGLTAHSYTKVMDYALQFGLTGIKINLSVIPKATTMATKDVLKLSEDQKTEMKKVSGLEVFTKEQVANMSKDERTKLENERGLGLSKDGTFYTAYLFEDESINWLDAIELENREGYDKNVGIICVGVSDEHIWKLLSDKNVRQVIPYHKSSLVKIVADMMNIGLYNDYTDQQNTRALVDGKWKSVNSKGMESYKDFDFYGAKDVGMIATNYDVQKTVKGYIDYCVEKEYLPKFDTFALVPMQNGGYSIDKATGKITKGGDYGINDEYYKVLIDFNAYDSQGNLAPQESVKMTLPNNFNELANDYLNRSEKLYRDIEKASPKIIDEFKKVLEEGSSASVSDQVDSDGNALSKGQVDYFKQSKARDDSGRLIKFYHGTDKSGFTVFDNNYANDGISTFFSSDPRIADSYVNRDKSVVDYANNTYKSIEDFNANYTTTNERIGVINDETKKLLIEGQKERLANSQKYNNTLGHKKFIEYINSEIEEIKNYENGKYYIYLKQAPQHLSIGSKLYDSEEEVLSKFGSNDYLNQDRANKRYEVYLDIENPIIVNAYGNNWNRLPTDATDNYGNNVETEANDTDADGNFVTNTRSWSKFAKENGYDGVIFKNIVDIGNNSTSRLPNSTVAVVFNSNQIKSTSNLNPTNNEDIRYSISDYGGYDGYSMSNRARTAYDEGRKPLSKFGKEDLDYYNESVDSSLKLNSVAELKKLLEYTSSGEYHHTGSMYNVTYFYDVEDAINNSNLDNVSRAKEKVANEREQNKGKVTIPQRLVLGHHDITNIQTRELNNLRNSIIKATNIDDKISLKNEYKNLLERYKQEYQDRLNRAIELEKQNLGKSNLSKREIEYIKNNIRLKNSQYSISDKSRNDTKDQTELTIFDSLNSYVRDYGGSVNDDAFSLIQDAANEYKVTKSISNGTLKMLNAELQKSIDDTQKIDLGYDKKQIKKFLNEHPVLWSDVQKDYRGSYKEFRNDYPFVKITKDSRQANSYDEIPDLFKSYVGIGLDEGDASSPNLKSHTEVFDAIKNLLNANEYASNSKELASQFDSGFNSKIISILKNLDNQSKLEVDTIPNLTTNPINEEKLKRDQQYFSDNVDKWLPEYNLIKTKFSGIDTPILNKALFEEFSTGDISEQTRVELTNNIGLNDFGSEIESVPQYVKDFEDYALNVFKLDTDYNNNKKFNDSVAGQTNKIMNNFDGKDYIQEYNDVEQNKKLKEEIGAMRMLTREGLANDVDIIINEASNKVNTLQAKNMWDYTRLISNGKRKTVDALNRVFNEPFFAAQTALKNTLQSEGNRLEKVIRSTGIRKNSKEAKAVGWLVEGKKQDGSKYDLTQLKKDFPKTWKNVQEFANEWSVAANRYYENINALRKVIYGDAKVNSDLRLAQLEEKTRLASYTVQNLEELNKKNPTKETYNSLKKARTDYESFQRAYETYAERIREREDKGREYLERRENYFHHTKDVHPIAIAKRIINNAKELIKGNSKNSGVPTSIAGKTDSTKPLTMFSTLFLHQGKSDYSSDGVQAWEDYISKYANIMAFDPYTFYLRDVSNEFAAQDTDSKANNIKTWLEKYISGMQGKSTVIDRAVRESVSPEALGVVKEINNRYKKNAVFGNLSSALIQVSNLPNGLSILTQNGGTRAIEDFTKGIVRTVKQYITGDDVNNKSAFMGVRYFDINTQDVGLYDNVQNLFKDMMQVFDEMTTKVLYNSFNAQAERLDKDSMWVDEQTRRSVGGRSIGELPIVLQSQIVNMLAPFQVEVNNQWQNLKNLTKDSVTGKNKVNSLAGIGVWMVSSWLLNNGFEAVIGRRPLVDLLEVILEGIKNEDDDDEITKTTLGRLSGEILTAMPAASNVVSAFMDEETSQDIFGESDPTKYGTANMGLSGIIDIILNANDDPLGSIEDAIFNLNSIGGGKQAQRILDTLRGFGVVPKQVNGEWVTDSINYSDSGKARFQNDTSNKMDWIKSILGGSWATSAAQDYVNGGFKQQSKTASTIMDTLNSTSGTRDDNYKIAQTYQNNRAEERTSDVENESLRDQLLASGQYGTYKDTVRDAYDDYLVEFFKDDANKNEEPKSFTQFANSYGLTSNDLKQDTYGDFYDTYNVSTDAQTKFAQAQDIENTVNVLGKTINNSAATQRRVIYEELGIYEDILEYIENNGLEYSDFGLSKTVVGYDKEDINKMLAKIAGKTYTSTTTSSSTKKSTSNSVSTSNLRLGNSDVFQYLLKQMQNQTKPSEVTLYKRSSYKA